MKTKIQKKLKLKLTAAKIKAVKKTAPLQEMKRNKPKVGRPRAADPKDKKAMAYFTQEEHKKLTELAHKKGYSLSNFVRIAALKQIVD